MRSSGRYRRRSSTVWRGHFLLFGHCAKVSMSLPGIIFPQNIYTPVDEGIVDLELHYEFDQLALDDLVGALSAIDSILRGVDAERVHRLPIHDGDGDRGG